MKKTAAATRGKRITAQSVMNLLKVLKWPLSNNGIPVAFIEATLTGDEIRNSAKQQKDIDING